MLLHALSWLQPLEMSVGDEIFNITLNKGLQTFLSEGHISFYTKVGGPDIFRNVIFSGYVTFYQINKVFVTLFFRSFL